MLRQLNSKGFKLSVPKKRYVLLQDHFLIFMKTNQVGAHSIYCANLFKGYYTVQSIVLGAL